MRLSSRPIPVKEEPISRLWFAGGAIGDLTVAAFGLACDHAHHQMIATASQAEQNPR